MHCALHVTCSILQAMWRLSSYLKLPWQPYIDILGETEYTLDASSSKVSHCMSHALSQNQHNGPICLICALIVMQLHWSVAGHRWCGMWRAGT